MARGVLMAATASFLLLAFSGCIGDDVTLTIDGVVPMERRDHADGSGYLRCDGGAEVTVKVTNNDDRVHQLGAAYWRVVFGDGDASSPRVVEGAREIAPDGRLTLMLWSCPSSGTAAAVDRVLLHDQDPSQPDVAARILGSASV